jgi:hypothetical protein
VGFCERNNTLLPDGRGGVGGGVAIVAAKGDDGDMFIIMSGGGKGAMVG